MLTQAVQDYLKAIYKLSEHGNAVTTNDLARELKVAAPSVTNMLKRLSEMNLASYTSYKGVTLSEAGYKAALEIIRHHRLLELYLQEALGYSWDKVHDEAETLEHHISEEFEDRIAAMLGDPSYDPHGDPIPRKNGTVPPTSTIPLISLEPGMSALILRVSDADPELLRYCASIGIVPHAMVYIVAKVPLSQTLTLRIGNNLEHHTIGNVVAERVFIECVG
ncbi:MAG: metal-dependent transcriptional regulator [Bacteroidota bacterium]|nr:metal-dependent transcriptional regulator [Candidatus Kapabacteria bacterium]MDW8219806.1 metal-dependent transcriptional regulator [Bacteroidota bacterium]